MIVEIELDIVQDYDIQQCIYEDLPLNTIDKSDYKTAFSLPTRLVCSRNTKTGVSRPFGQSTNWQKAEMATRSLH